MSAAFRPARVVPAILVQPRLIAGGLADDDDDDDDEINDVLTCDRSASKLQSPVCMERLPLNGVEYCTDLYVVSIQVLVKSHC